MTVEQKAEEYRKSFNYCRDWHGQYVDKSHDTIVTESFIAGYHEGFKDCAKARLNTTTISDCPIKDEWHDLEKDPTDLPEGDEYSLKGIHRKILLQDRYGNIYTGNYYSKDQNHRADCFAVEFLDWGLQGSNFCAKEQIIKWKEIE